MHPSGAAVSSPPDGTTSARVARGLERPVDAARRAERPAPAARRRPRPVRGAPPRLPYRRAHRAHPRPVRRRPSEPAPDEEADGVMAARVVYDPARRTTQARSADLAGVAGKGGATRRGERSGAISCPRHAAPPRRRRALSGDADLSILGAAPATSTATSSRCVRSSFRSEAEWRAGGRGCSAAHRPSRLFLTPDSPSRAPAGANSPVPARLSRGFALADGESSAPRCASYSILEASTRRGSVAARAHTARQRSNLASPPPPAPDCRVAPHHARPPSSTAIERESRRVRSGSRRGAAYLPSQDRQPGAR